nr:hypothetical protein [Tanacetum cinerariifolium]
MRRVGKGFLGVETPLFEGMLVAHEVTEEGDAEVHGEEVNAGDVAEGDVSVAHGEVSNVAEEPSILYPTPPTLSPQPSHDIPSTSQRVETSDETVMDDVANQERMIAEIDQDADVVLEDDIEVVDDVKDVQDDIDESAQDQGRKVESQAEIYKIDLEHANKVLSMQEDETKLAKVQEVVYVVTTTKIITKVVTAASETITAASTTIIAAEAQVPAATLTAAPSRVTAAPRRRTNGVVIRDPKESTTSTIIPTETKSKDKGKGILVEEPKPLKKQQQIEQDEKYARELEAELNKILIGMKLLTIESSKRQKLDEEVEELKRHLQIVPNEDDDVYTKATALARKVPVVDFEIIEQNNKPYYKIIRADGTHQLYISFLTLLKNFDREDLEALWSLVKERFATTKPKNFSNDFLLVTLEAMFEKPDIHAQIWKNQRSVHGPAKVKGWKLLESCGVQIITFTTTQLILLVKRKYPLTRFTLDQMLNVVRLKVNEESEVSLELLRFIRQQHQEDQLE